jgi:hypothetical protein
MREQVIAAATAIVLATHGPEGLKRTIASIIAGIAVLRSPPPTRETPIYSAICKGPPR